MAELAVYHSLIDPDSLSAWLSAHYTLGARPTCRFIRMGLNDTYEVQSLTTRYIVRIYRAAWRSVAAIQAEVAALQWLAAKQVPVASVVLAKDGSAWQTFDAPEGPRTIVVFAHIDGHALRLDAKQAAAYGKALASLHGASDDFRFPTPRFCLDESHLITEPLHHIERAFGHHRQALQHLHRCAAAAKAVLATLPLTTPYYGFCHGDHFGNVLQTDQHACVFIDFDCCGMGFRAYDLVQFWWALRLRMTAWQETFLASDEVLWQAFLRGYEAMRPLTRQEKQALPALFTIRTLWGLGLQPQNDKHWGIEGHEAIWQQNYALLVEIDGLLQLSF